MLSRAALLALLPLAGARSFRPASIDSADLVDDQRFSAGSARDQLSKALTVDGLVQVVGIPDFAGLRERVLHDAHACIGTSPRAQEVTFADQTVRRTLAAASGAAAAGREIGHGSDSEACRRLDRSAALFRETVGGVADAFAKRLGGLLELEPSSALMQTRQGDAYETFEEAVRAGERLEHFHSYAVQERAAASAAENTLDFHTDQGLFIAFAPALMVGGEEPRARGATPSGAFVVKGAGGQELEAELQADGLVFLLGDGVDRFVNVRHRGAPLKAPSHAFRMPPCCSGWHRLWYGMMQLPPADALVEDTGLTFGEIREQVTLAAGSLGEKAEAAMSVGCSRKLQARELMASCNATQLYCWHRCYDYTPTVSPTACAAQNSGFNCTNQFDQIYLGGHGDYQPKCTNSTELYSPRPPVVQPTGNCTGFSALVADSAFAHRVELDRDTTYLLWNVANGELHMKMLHNGAVGWMAVGLENVGGYHNGMNGAHVVMMKNDPVAGASLEEYNIHPMMSAHRHWKQPLSPSALSNKVMEVTGCFSSMTFTTATFHNRPLNLTAGSGENRMIWALTHLDYPTQDFGGYAGYHSTPNFRGDPAVRAKYRGKVELDLPAGLRLTPAPTPSPTATPTPAPPQEQTSGARTVLPLSGVALLLVALPAALRRT